MLRFLWRPVRLKAGTPSLFPKRCSTAHNRCSAFPRSGSEKASTPLVLVASWLVPGTWWYQHPILALKVDYSARLSFPKQTTLGGWFSSPKSYPSPRKCRENLRKPEENPNILAKTPENHRKKPTSTLRLGCLSWWFLSI